MAFQTFKNDENNKVQIKRKNLKNEIRSTWLGLKDGNITFSDELNFDPAKLDAVYEDDRPGLSQ